VVAAIAGFLVVFELLANQLRSGHDPAIGTGPLTAQVRSGSAASGQPGSSTALVTRASGGATTASQATPAPVAARSAQHPSHSIATRTSGGGARPGSSPTFDDDANEQEGRL
jgi:hypothetical protein